MAKKQRLFTAMILVIVFAALCALTACSSAGRFTFEKREYEVKNGEVVNVAKGKAAYKLLGDVPQGVSVSSDGKFSVGSDAKYGAQTVLAAIANGKVTDTVVCKVIIPLETPTITFTNRSQYLADGEQAHAVSDPAYSLVYSLKENVSGVVVDEVTGRVSFRGAVEDATPFTVVASAQGVSAEKRFFAATANFVTVDRPEQVTELGVGSDLNFTLNFGADSNAEQQGVLYVETLGAELAQDKYSYNSETHVLTLYQATVASFASGENAVYVGTAKNTVTLNIRAAKFVRTAEDLAAIATGSVEGLNAYYVQVEDIDLTEYLSTQQNGWFPIGTYLDDAGVVDATRVFGGHYDGNGHTISGLWIARQHYTFVEGFNGGLFGYVSSNGIVENVTLKSADGKANELNSYSGGLVGHNCGIIRNCMVDVNVFLISEHTNGGGVCGMNEGTISNCISLGFVTAGENLGAICGYNFNGVIENCYAVDDPNNAYRVQFNNEQSDEETGSSVIVNPLVYPNRPQVLPVVGKEAGTTTNSFVFTSVDELLQQADFSFWSNWNTDGSGLPTVKGIATD